MISHDLEAPPLAGQAPGRGIALAAWRVRLTVLGVALAFGCSAMLLTHVGFRYGSTGGSPLEKFHPSSYVLSAAFALLLLEGGFSRITAWILARHPLSAVYLACLGYHAAYVAIVIGRPVTFVIDTLTVPCLLFLLLCRTSPAALGRIALVIHVVLNLNAVIGFSEAAFKWRLIPFYLNDGPIDYDWRSTALLGHPLQNAAITAIYAFLLLTGPRGGLPRHLVLPAFALQFLALPAFGGRTATVLLMGLGVLWILKEALLIAFGKGFPLRKLLWLCLCIPVLAAFLWSVSDSAYVVAFLDRFVDDDGSAEARVRMLGLFANFSWEELVLGPKPADLDAAGLRAGLEYGIESFVIAMLLQNGIFAASLVFAGLAAFSVDLGRVLSRPGIMALVFFLSLNVSSTGLSSKGVTFTLFVALVMALDGSERGTWLNRRLRETMTA